MSSALTETLTLKVRHTPEELEALADTVTDTFSDFQFQHLHCFPFAASSARVPLVIISIKHSNVVNPLSRHR